MLPEPIRAPVEIRGDVPGLLVRGMPVARHDGTAPGVVSAVVSDFCCYIAEVPADYFARYHDPYTRRSRCLDWTSPLAIYAAIHWLADRGHPCLWMLPTTHGGRVEAWDGLSAWEVSAILVSVSVGRVAAGKGPIVRLRRPPAVQHGTDGIVTLNGYRFADEFAALAERDKCNRAALTDGAALCVDGGIAVEAP